jgi:hypothetical protein
MENLGGEVRERRTTGGGRASEVEENVLMLRTAQMQARGLFPPNRHGSIAGGAKLQSMTPSGTEPSYKARWLLNATSAWP